MDNQWQGTAGPGGPTGGGRVLVALFAVVLALGALVGYRTEFAGSNGHGPEVSADLVQPVAPAPLDPDEITRVISPVLVNVTASGPLFGASAAGSGIVVGEEGQVLTSHHVVKGAKTVQVSLVADGAAYSAEVLGYDARADIALLELSGASGLETARIGSSAELRVHDEVLAIGNAGGSGAPSAVTGRISDLDSTITAVNEQDLSRQALTGMLEIEAEVSSGQSGGALADHTGAVVGVVAAASGERDPPRNEALDPPTGYAVPIDAAMHIVDRIRAGDASESVHVGPTATLGVVISDASPRGARIDLAVPDLPAERAGLSSGEIVTSLDDRAITSARALHAVINSHVPDDLVRVGILERDGDTRVVEVRLAPGVPR